MTCFAFAEHVKKAYNLEPIHVFLSGASAPYVSVICSVCCHICPLYVLWFILLQKWDILLLAYYLKNYTFMCTYM